MLIFYKHFADFNAHIPFLDFSWCESVHAPRCSSWVGHLFTPIASGLRLASLSPLLLLLWHCVVTSWMWVRAADGRSRLGGLRHVCHKDLKLFFLLHRKVTACLDWQGQDTFIAKSPAFQVVFGC